MNSLRTSRPRPLTRSIRRVLPLVMGSLMAASVANAETWTINSGTANWSSATWAEGIGAGDQPSFTPPPITDGSYTNIRINLQGGVTTYQASDGIQTYDVAATGGETRGLFLSNTGGANATLTMTGGELRFLQDGSTSAVGLTNAALTSTINLNGGKLTINEADANADTRIDIGFGGGGTGIVNINSGGVLTSDIVSIGATNSELNLNSGGLLVTRNIIGVAGSKLTIDGGTIQQRGNTGSNLIDSTVASATINGGGLTVDTAGFNGVINKALTAGTGAGGLIKNGNGALTLTGTNTYAGATVVNQGTLQLGNGGITGTLLTGSTLTMAAGTTLRISRSDNLTQSTFVGAGSTFQSGLSGDVSFSKGGAGILNVDVANSYLGGTSVLGGVLRLTHAAGLGAAGGLNTVASGASLALSGGITVNGENIAIVGAGVGAIASSEFVAVSRGALQSSSGDNTFGGNITVDSVASFTRIGVQDGASLTLTGSITGGGAATSLIFRGGGAGAITLSGSGNAWIGNTETFGGTLRNGVNNAISPGSTLIMGAAGVSTPTVYDLNGYNQTIAGLTNNTGVGGSSTITNSGASNSVLTLSGTVDRAFVGVISDGGTNKISVVKDGTFVQSLSGINTYTGNTTVTAGTLTLVDNARLKFVIGASGTNNFIDGSGTLTLAGDFSFDLSGASTTFGSSWLIVDVTNLTETFAPSFSVLGFTDNLNDTWSSGNYLFDEGSGTLSVVPEPSTALLGGFGVLALMGRRRRTN